MSTKIEEKEKTEGKAKKGTAAKGFQPLGDRVFVTYTEEMERTAGGIYVPETAKEKPQRGTVQATGKDVKDLKVGDQVLFDKYSGSKLHIDGEDCLILKEEDILGIFTS
ncbi:MAG: co-chaperone GroES [Nitrospira sp.]|nr:co-chaperone GroES [Nitrospira sp.]